MTISLPFLRCALMCAAIAVGMAKESAEAQESKRPVTVADCIEMTKLADPQYWIGGSSVGRVAQFSPDGRKFVVVLRKGNVERNTNEYTVLLWKTDEVIHRPAPAPVALLTMSSSSNREAIRDVTWLDDNDSVMFLGVRPGEPRQVYVFNTRTRVLRRLTDHQAPLVSYSATPNGRQIAYVAERTPDSIWNAKTREQGTIVSAQRLWNLVRGESSDGEGYYANRELFIWAKGKRSGPLDVKGSIDLYHSSLALSPDGEHILIRTKVAEVPEEWKEYSDPEIQQLSKQRLRRGLYSYLTRYVLIDTTTKTSRVLMNSPVGDGESEVVWLPDGHSVAISGVYLPLEHTDRDEREVRRSSTFTIEVNLKNLEISKITQEALKLIGWDARANGLVFEANPLAAPSGNAQRIFFQKVGDNWEQKTEDVFIHRLPEITLEEDMNASAKIYAADFERQRKTLLLDLNPQFEALKFARVEEISWKGSDGRKTKGGLYYPVDFMPGRRYPLVIQTHGWNPRKFWVDGPWTSAFAAQPLAGKGFAVLQVPDPEEELEETPDEPVRAVAAYEGAIDYLDTIGLIDRAHVGLIGFSRTGLYVRYALTHSRYQFAAASVMDSTDGGYFQYLGGFNTAPGWSESYEKLNGGLPFGKGLCAWMEHSPGFNIDRVQTPIRIVAPRPDSVLFEWEWFASLSRLGRPVEMIMIEDGEHILQKPRDRIVSQEGNVDWFCFWLKGEEDSDPAKMEQYLRWRELRKLQENGEKATDK